MARALGLWQEAQFDSCLVISTNKWDGGITTLGGTNTLHSMKTSTSASRWTATQKNTMTLRFGGLREDTLLLHSVI